MTDSTQQRINQLERDKRWWKRLAIGFIAAFAIILVGSGAASLTLARQARNQALLAEQHARQLQLKMEREVEKRPRSPGILWDSAEPVSSD
jgi:hypothetical protein